MANDKEIEKRQSPAEKPISLKPLNFDEAVSALLKAKPEDKKAKSYESGTGNINNKEDRS